MDQATLDSYAQGSNEALGEIVRAYSGVLRSFIYGIVRNSTDADDVLQETFIQMHISRHTFDPSRPLYPWMMRIAGNKAKDALRKRQKNPCTVLSDVYEDFPLLEQLAVWEEDDGVWSSLDGMIGKEEGPRLRSYLDRLCYPHREILTLYYFGGLKYEQISQALHIPLGTVRSRLYAAKRSLRRIYAAEPC